MDRQAKSRLTRLRVVLVKYRPAARLKICTAVGLRPLQDRYLETSQGDTYARVKRSGKGPNRLSQAVRGLVPGKLYSVKLLSADYDDLLAGKSDRKPMPLSITITGGELIHGKIVSGTFTAMLLTGHSDPFSAKNRFWNTYEQRVFRAQAAEARLTLSDWQGDDAPGRPEGQQVLLNFVEIQPFLED